MVAPDHVTDRTRVVDLEPIVVTGGENFTVPTVRFPPGATRNLMKKSPSGICTARLFVDAVLLSFGTRNVMFDQLCAAWARDTEGRGALCV